MRSPQLSTQIRIFLELRRGDMTTRQLATALGLSRSVVWNHLRTLEQAGIVGRLNGDTMDSPPSHQISTWYLRRGYLT